MRGQSVAPSARSGRRPTSEHKLTTSFKGIRCIGPAWWGAPTDMGQRWQREWVAHQQRIAFRRANDDEGGRRWVWANLHDQECVMSAPHTKKMEGMAPAGWLTKRRKSLVGQGRAGRRTVTPTREGWRRWLLEPLRSVGCS
jgi:hypothetical protein